MEKVTKGVPSNETLSLFASLRQDEQFHALTMMPRSLQIPRATGPLTTDSKFWNSKPKPTFVPSSYSRSQEWKVQTVTVSGDTYVKIPGSTARPADTLFTLAFFQNEEQRR